MVQHRSARMSMCAMRVAIRRARGFNDNLVALGHSACTRILISAYCAVSRSEMPQAGGFLGSPINGELSIQHEESLGANLMMRLRDWHRPNAILDGKWLVQSHNCVGMVSPSAPEPERGLGADHQAIYLDLINRLERHCAH